MTIPKTHVLIEYNRSAKPVFQFTENILKICSHVIPILQTVSNFR